MAGRAVRRFQGAGSQYVDQHVVTSGALEASVVRSVECVARTSQMTTTSRTTRARVRELVLIYFCYLHFGL